ncbi:unnamed protein product, partial [Closterium sp. NIES-54]
LYNEYKANDAVTMPLREMVESIQESVSKIEDDLKVRASEYTTVRSQLSAINRKAGGSMLVRDLSTIVQDSDIIVSEHITTHAHCFPSLPLPLLPFLLLPFLTAACSCRTSPP